MTKEALKLALEALGLAKHSHGVLLLSDPPQEAWKTYQVDAALSKAITAIKEALANEALEKMAENARELGLDYEPAQKPCGGCKGSGWVTRDPDIGTDQECFVCGGSGAYPKEPEQEPVVFWDGESRFVSQKTKEWDKRTGGTLGFGCDIALYTTPPQGIYYTPPQRTWVGLTDEEILSISADCASSHQHMDIQFARAIESKLKAKNT